MTHPPLCTLALEKYGIWSLVLNRPETRNALSDDLIKDLTEALQKLAQLPAEECRILTLSAQGTVFCAGADLHQMKEKKDLTFEQNLAQAKVLGQLFYALASFPAPVVCAVQGAAIGGGLGLVACCDFVVAEENAVFATSEVLLGIVPGVISPYVVRKLGVTHGTDLMLTGRRVTAATAKDIGLLNHVTKSHDLYTVQQELVENLKKAGPHALRRTKTLIQKAAPLPDPSFQEWTAQQIAEARVSLEGQEGLGAFLTKTSPPWKANT